MNNLRGAVGIYVCVTVSKEKARIRMAKVGCDWLRWNFE